MGISRSSPVSLVHTRRKRLGLDNLKASELADGVLHAVVNIPMSSAACIVDGGGGQVAASARRLPDHATKSFQATGMTSQATWPPWYGMIPSTPRQCVPVTEGGGFIHPQD
jgi:hypothetical protein